MLLSCVFIYFLIKYRDEGDLLTRIPQGSRLMEQMLPGTVLVATAKGKQSPRGLLLTWLK